MVLIEAWRVAIENIMENAFRYAKSYIKIEVKKTGCVLVMMVQRC